ncbi:MAG TPA: ThuA domain-containing protein [Vicinamibacterales bacterium]|nr:ThuA domain-containing protein [Vicinamibacterales bacterium]
MRLSNSKTAVAVAVCGAALLATSARGTAQQPAAAAPQGQPGPGRAGGGGGGRGGGVAPALFTAVDTNKDGSVSRAELKGSFDTWFTSWDTSRSGSLTQDQLAAGLTAAMPQAPPAAAAQPGPDCGGRSNNPRTPCAADVQAMMGALPATAPAKPKQPRKILVLGAAQGFVHSSIPLAAKTMEAMGEKTKAWTATVTYDPADINEQNLKQYDAVFLDSTTGCFLDDANDKAATAARRQALMSFVRSGKGIAAIHASTDSYHGTACPGDAPAPAGRAGGFGGGRGGPGPTLAMLIVTQGDKNSDLKISRDELAAVADGWFDKIDTAKAGTVSQADFGQRWASVTPQAAPAAARSGAPGGNPLWPEFNKMMGGYFKFHWNDPQEITYKIDDPKSPLTVMFKGAALVVQDETYTFNQESFSRDNVHVLTSVDYSKMSDADKAKEPNPRTDHDYALSYIKREGNGRMFYMTHGHHERNYAVKPLMEHLLAGVQYALGDLKADDSPSTKGGTK